MDGRPNRRNKAAFLNFSDPAEWGWDRCRLLVVRNNMSVRIMFGYFGSCQSKHRDPSNLMSGTKTAASVYS